MRASCIFLVHPTHTCTHTLRTELHTQFSRELPFHLSSQKLTDMWQAPLAYLVLLHSSFIYPHADFLCWNFLLYIVLCDYTTLFSYRNSCNSCHNITFYVMWSPRLAWYKSVRSTKVAKTVLVSSPHQTFYFIAHKYEPSHFSSSYVICCTFKTSMNELIMAQTS